MNKLRAERLAREAHLSHARRERFRVVAAIVATIALAFLATAAVASWATHAASRRTHVARAFLLALLLAAGCATCPPGLRAKVARLESAIALDHSATAPVSTDTRTVAAVASHRAAIRANVAAIKEAVPE